MNVTLNRQDVVTLYRHLREADRSLHFLMNPAKDWDEFLAYYHQQKRELLEEFLDEVLLPWASAAPEPPKPRFVGFWRFWLAKHLARPRQDWAFPIEELARIVQQGRAFLQLLANRSKPQVNELVAQRQGLRDAQVLIEARCYGMHELKEAEATGHFDQLAQPAQTEVA
jgi:hypothetical protein